MRAQAIAAYAAIATILLIAAAVTTQVRYGSLQPCDWLRVDSSRQSNLPESIVRARIQARFLLRGVITPGPGDCLAEWWRVRLKGLPEKTTTR